MTATPESPPAGPHGSATPPTPDLSEEASRPGSAEGLLPEKLAASPQLASLPPEAWEPLLRVARFATRPLERFLRIQAASGIALIVAATVALIWANSPWAESYAHLWHTTLGLRLGELSFERSLEWFVNDALMVIFFFVVGMEIRREIHAGELSELRRAALPAIAALGGVAVPAVCYLAIAGMPETRSGWAVPTATDIAFAVGVLTLLGKRVPAALRVLLLALAVIDDLVAILIIAFFYSAGVEASGFLLAALGLGLIFLLQALGVRQPAVYVGPGVVLWAGIYSAGVHPTIAGVIIGLATPVLPWRGVSPAESLIEALHPWVAYGIMPVFALANAGVTLSGVELDAASTRVIL
ncbi:MAG: Na+/H+ antiporter NhaA, partial [Deltaproteobacteria bacterium]|nr:Na+/H+ antiporter NhaA [Deltaproteobacteria bacterium]